MEQKQEIEKRARTTAQLLRVRGPVDRVTIDNFISLEEYRQVVPKVGTDD